MKHHRFKKYDFYDFVSLSSNKALRKYSYCIIFIAILVIFVSGIVAGKNLDTQEPPAIYEPTDSVLPVEETSALGALKTVSVQNSEVGYGDLILVNYNYMVAYEEPTLVPMIENSEYDYSISDYNVSLNVESFKYADKMLGDFESQNGGTSDLNVSCGYRSKQTQNDLYSTKLQNDGKEEADKWIAKAGYSEHQTGYAFDLCLIIDGYTYDFTGENEYKWIKDNSAKYGFILRYPQDKVDITHIEYEPWHFRYVGVPHAAYIQANNICFEEYIDLVHTKSVSNPLVVDYDGSKYAIYYTPKSNLTDKGDFTDIQVPESYEYTISGDNVSGFIVTVKLS